VAPLTRSASGHLELHVPVDTVVAEQEMRAGGSTGSGVVLTTPT
jgi:hypothetical protein